MGKTFIIDAENVGNIVFAGLNGSSHSICPNPDIVATVLVSLATGTTKRSDYYIDWLDVARKMHGGKGRNADQLLDSLRFRETVASARNHSLRLCPRNMDAIYVSRRPRA